MCFIPAPLIGLFQNMSVSTGIRNYLLSTVNSITCGDVIDITKLLTFSQVYGNAEKGSIDFIFT